MRTGTFVGLALASVALATSGCGTSSSSGGSDGGSGSDSGSSDGGTAAFVGAWTCVETSDAGPAGTNRIVFAANPDGTLALTPADGSTCSPNKWTVSGSVATAAAGQTCTGGLGGPYTINSGSFTVSGGTATYSLQRFNDSTI